MSLEQLSLLRIMPSGGLDWILFDTQTHNTHSVHVAIQAAWDFPRETISGIANRRLPPIYAPRTVHAAWTAFAQTLWVHAPAHRGVRRMSYWRPMPAAAGGVAV